MAYLFNTMWRMKLEVFIAMKKVRGTDYLYDESVFSPYK